VEIGAGTGEYLCSLASQRADVNFVGIEASKRAAYYATKLAAERGIRNLRVIKANVKLLYPLIPSGAWSSVYIHFPDPAHKRKDEKHRVFDRAFLDVMARALLPGGEISVVSDKVDFFREMLEIIKVDSRFERMHAEDYLDGFEPEEKSRFQLFWEGKGVRPRRFIFRKR